MGIRRLVAYGALSLSLGISCIYQSGYLASHFNNILNEGRIQAQGQSQLESVAENAEPRKSEQNKLMPNMEWYRAGALGTIVVLQGVGGLLFLGAYGKAVIDELKRGKNQKQYN